MPQMIYLRSMPDEVEIRELSPVTVNPNSCSQPMLLLPVPSSHPSDAVAAGEIFSLLE